MDSFTILKHCHLFSGCNQTQLQDLSTQARVRQLSAGEILFDLNDPSEELYVLYAGCVSFQYHLASGNKITLGVAEAGMIIGDMELLDPTPRKSRAMVLQDAVICILPKNDFLSLCRKNVSLYEKILRMYSRRLQQAARIMLIKDDEQLFYSILLSFAKRFGVEREEGIEISLYLPQEELASHVGVPRQRLNKMLGQLKEEGVLDTQYGSVVIFDMDSLAKKMQ